MKSVREISLKPADRAAIEQAAAIIRTAVPVRQIFLFGSKARGDDDPESDIDLLVLTERPLTWAERGALRERIYPLEMSLNVCLSAIYVPFGEWISGMMQAHPLKAEVEREGAVA